jgi:hypothetical protein
MRPDQNPFPPEDAERHALWQAHMFNDIEAFLRADWDAVKDDFDAETFVAIDARFQSDPALWQVGFPDLDAYRRAWLHQAGVTAQKADPDRLREALFRGARIARIDFFEKGTAILHKVFDGQLPLRNGDTEAYAWQSVFTLRKRDGAWKIQSFVGYIGGGRG